jgi:putative membrane protein
MNHPRSKLSLYLISVLMGFCGLAVPGLSASTIAIIFLVYYDMIYAISHIFTQPKKSITFLLILVAGYATGALVGAVAVNTIYLNFPVPMVGAVLGFLLGTIPRMTVETKNDFKKPVNWVVMIVVAGIFLLYTLLVGGEQELVFIENQIEIPKDYILMLIVGIVTSTTLVVPGVDFAVTLMALGYYYAIIDLMGNIGSLILFPSRLFLLLAYVVGYGIGAFFLSKGLRYLSKRFPRQVHCVNYALVCVAPLIVLKKCVIDNANFMPHFTGPQMVWAIALFAAGFFAYTWVPIALRYVGLIPKNTEEEALKRAEAARADLPNPKKAPVMDAADATASAENNTTSTDGGQE